MAESTPVADSNFIAELQWYYNALHAGIMVLDPDLNILFSNNWLKSRLSIPKPHLAAIFGSHDMEKTRHLVLRAIRHRQSRLVSQALHRWLIPIADRRFSDGLMRQTCLVNPLQCPYTRTVYALVQIRDDSDAVLKTTKLFRIQKHLEKRTADLEASNQELRKSRSKWAHVNKMEALNTMIRGIAHNFNNTLGVILGNTEILQNHQVDETMLQECIGDIHRAALTARDTVRQIIAFNRKSGVKLTRLDLVEMVAGALNLLQVNWPKTIALKWHPPAKAIYIQGDAAMLQQVVINLLTNALQAVTPHKGRIEVQLDTVSESEAKLTPNRPANVWARLRIRDNGHGIEDPIGSKIFDPYFTTRGFENNSGLGLTVVHGIIRNHKARIDFVSPPGEGTTFTILFPLEQDNDDHRSIE